MPRLLTRACLLLSAVLLVPASPLTAQEEVEAGGIACFRIHPAPRCRSYWIVEVQGVFPVYSSTQTHDFRGTVDVFDDRNLEFNLGHMVNVTPGISAGAALVLGSGSGGVPDGVRGRVRWWATPGASLELEGGVLWTNLGSGVGSPLAGPSVGARLNVRDMGAVFLRYDRVNVPSDGPWSGGPASALSVGASASSGGAIIVSALIGLGLLVLVLVAPGGS